MNFKEFYEEQILKELFVKRYSEPLDEYNVIAYKSHVFIFNEDDEIDGIEANEILQKLNIEDNPFEGGDYIPYYDIADEIRNNDRSDILVGWVKNKILYISNVGAFTIDPKSSILAKKIANVLKLKAIQYSDDIDGDTAVKIPKKKIEGKIPDIAYHGTAEKYIESILKTGLEPKEYQSNYAKQGIYHDDKIFFTTRFGEASHHAITTGNNTRSTPIVLEFNIPDKNLIVPDYDVDMMGGQTTYKNYSPKSAHTKLPNDRSYGLSREFGVYGYLGKIIPQHIRWVWILTNDTDLPTIKDYRKISPKRLRQLFDKGYDLETIKYM